MAQSLAGANETGDDPVLAASLRVGVDRKVEPFASQPGDELERIEKGRGVKRVLVDGVQIWIGGQQRSRTGP